MDIYLNKVLSLIRGEYVIGFADKNFKDMHELEQYLDEQNDNAGNARLTVESICVSDGQFQVNVVRNTIIPNDMNGPWVQEHIARYRKELNIFDGC